MSWLKRLEYQLKLERYKRQDYPIIYMNESGFENETIRPCINRYNWQACFGIPPFLLDTLLDALSSFFDRWQGALKQLLCLICCSLDVALARTYSRLGAAQMI